MKPTDEIAIAAGINAGLSGCNNSLMIATLGRPRSVFTQDCAAITNKQYAKRIKTNNVGPFKVTGFDLAVDDLKRIFDEVRAVRPAEYAMLSSAGMLCCRLVRGSKTSISNHSWGTAIDLKINGVLDVRGNGRAQAALNAIAPIFNKHGWFWGATFRIEDAMHFEASAQRLTQWKKEGKV
jgi:hypothetical protein